MSHPAPASPPPRQRAAASKALQHASAGRRALAAGQNYEAAVLRAVEVYRQRLAIAHPIAASLHHAQPVAKCIGRRAGAPVWVMEGKSGPDLYGVARGGRAVVAEVKGARTPSLPLHRHGEPLVDPVQAEQLAHAEAAGALAGLVARVASPKPRGRATPPPRWYWIPWRSWAALVAACDGASLGVAALDGAVAAGVAALVDCSQGWPDWLAAAMALDGAARGGVAGG